MRLNYSQQYPVLYRVFTVKFYVFVLFCGFIFSTQAKIIDTGLVVIGDDLFLGVQPTSIIEANSSEKDPESILDSPKPLSIIFQNPIPFSLDNITKLNQISLLNAFEIDASLYFVIWDSDDVIKVNVRSFDNIWSNSETLTNVTLDPGDYRIAVVGQCFKKKGHNFEPQGWNNTCKTGNSGNSSYDDFGFWNIELDVETLPPSTVNHFRIEHPDSALTCEPALVTIKACSTDASDTTCELADVDENIELRVSTKTALTIFLLDWSMVRQRLVSKV